VGDAHTPSQKKTGSAYDRNQHEIGFEYDRTVTRNWFSITQQAIGISTALQLNTSALETYAHGHTKY
jgi:hypothetical protein